MVCITINHSSPSVSQSFLLIVSGRSRTFEWKLADSRLTACQQVKMMGGQRMHKFAAFTTSGLLNLSKVATECSKY